MAAVTGGDKIERVLARIGSKASGLVKVGYLEGATYPDGTPVATVAFWQEFGTPGARFPIPPRPTFRTMIAQHSKDWGKQLGERLKQSSYDGKKALGLMGETMRDELVESVLTADVAPLSPVTLMLRQMRDENPALKVGVAAVFEAIRRVQTGESGAGGTRAKRLVDSGTMERAPDYEVIDGS